jgi:transcriptional regulator with GAF, ATPase, and Fis domain
MVELADNLVDDFDIVDLLAALTERCIDVLDITAAGIMLADSADRLRPMISSDETARVTELYAIQSEDGPCQECFVTGTPVVNHDLTTSHDRWPRFAPAALAAGFRSVDAIPMRLRGQVIGALNLLRGEVGALGAEDVARAQALADIATIAILQNRIAVEAQVMNTQLGLALSSRISIEQARGVVAERHRVTPDEAFDWLRRYARDNHLRLADLARATVFGDIDPIDITPRS